MPPPPSDAAPDPTRGIAGWLVGRPITVLMLFLSLMGTGILAYQRIPLTLLPEDFVDSSLSVWLPYPGAGPQEVLDQLTRPVEEALRTIPGIREVYSESQEGGSSVTVSFSGDTDMDVAYGEVRDRIERIRGSLPPEMDRYNIFKWDPVTDIPVVFLGVRYDDEAEDPFGPIERIVIPRLEGVAGVARIQSNGIVDEVLRIFVDIDKVVGYGIDLGQVIRRMQADNFTLPAGQVDDGGRTFNVRVDTRFQSLEEVAAYPVGNGRVLGDVADIVPTRAFRDRVWRINGRPAVGLDVSRESDENTIEVCQRVEDAVAELADDPRLEGIEIDVFWTQKEEILLAVDGLKSSAGWGGLFAVLVLYFFLRDLRMTLISALAIPASLLVALMVTYFSGFKLNMLTLAGFTLAIGMLVDNAVVVMENISRKRAEGLARLDAAARGAGEVGLAVLTATLTSVAVFLPLVFMDGERNAKVFLRELGLPITWSLTASLLVAMVFIPAFTARLMAARGREHHARALSPRLIAAYRSALSWSLRHRFQTVILLVVAWQLSGWAGSQVPDADMGGDEGWSVTAAVELPSNFTLSDANDAFVKYEAWAAEHKDALGVDIFSSRFGRQRGRLNFYPREDLPRERREALPDALRDGLPQLPGITLTVDRDRSSTSTDVALVLSGPDFGVLADLAEQLKPRIAGLTYADGDDARPLFENVRTDVDRGLDEVHVRVDRERAAELGVAPEAVRGVVSWGLGGQRLPDIQIGEREIKVAIEYGQKDAESLEFLRNIGLYRDTGEAVPLASVATLDMSRSVGVIVRRDNITSMAVTATPALKDVMRVSSALGDVLREFPLPEGYSWTEEGGREEFELELDELFRTLLMSVALIYLLMAILLESAVLPLSILLSVPLALMGVNFSLWAFGFERDIMVYIGMILLAGVVVNNAIVLLDKVQRLRAEGASRLDALVTGGGERLRPILMTALTTIFGLLPMAAPTWFPGGESESGYESMAVTVAGGLAFSSLFTLLVVPVFYTFFDDLGRVSSALLPGRRARDGAPDAEGAEPAA